MISRSSLFVIELRFDNRFFSIKRTYYLWRASVCWILRTCYTHSFPTRTHDAPNFKQDWRPREERILLDYPKGSRGHFLRLGIIYKGRLPVLSFTHIIVHMDASLNKLISRHVLSFAVSSYSHRQCTARYDYRVQAEQIGYFWSNFLPLTRIWSSTSRWQSSNSSQYVSLSSIL